MATVRHRHAGGYGERQGSAFQALKNSSRKDDFHKQPKNSGAVATRDHRAQEPAQLDKKKMIFKTNIKTNFPGS